MRETSRIRCVGCERAVPTEFVSSHASGTGRYLCETYAEGLHITSGGQYVAALSLQVWTFLMVDEKG
jgi:hypothetical protein